MRILIVEDNVQISNQLFKAFQEVFIEAEIMTTNSIITAEELLKQYTFDAISLDVLLPDGDGLELAKELRLYPYLQDAVLLMVTGIKDFSVGFAAYDIARCHKFITKPFVQSDLINHLYELKGIISTRKAETFFQFQNKHMSLRIRNRDILYAEMSIKNVILHTINGSIDLGRVSIKSLAPLLGEDFLQIHRSYIVNYHKIVFLKKNSQSWCVQLNHNEIKLDVGINYRSVVNDLFLSSKKNANHLQFGTTK